MSESLASTQTQLTAKTTLSDELQRSLSLIKEELATTLQRSEQTKRHLEDQLAGEERAREELQEQNLEFRKVNKKLVKDLEKEQGGGAAHGGGSGGGYHSRSGDRGGFVGGEGGGGGTPGSPMRGGVRNRIEFLQQQLDRAQMREHDLLGVLARTSAVASPGRPPPMRRALSRMPSTAVITRYVPSADVEAKGQGPHASSSGGGPSGHGGVGNSGGSWKAGGHGGASGFDSESDMQEEDSVEMNDRSFEMYHQEVHRMLTEIEEGKDKLVKQQKVTTVRSSPSVYALVIWIALIGGRLHWLSRTWSARTRRSATGSRSPS